MAYTITPIGFTHSKDKITEIKFLARYAEAIQGLEKYSHILLIVWFHARDTESARKMVKVHPGRNRKNPLTGIFATRSPVRPNPVGIFTSEILSIENDKISVSRIDVFDETPVIDIKPYIPSIDFAPSAKMPDWI